MLDAIAPAKLNLSLHLVGKRGDGYHLLDSLVAFTDFGDALRITPSEMLTLSVSGPYAGEAPAENNLVMQAAYRLRDAYGVAGGAHIKLHKKLPVGAGLGGGSSDAATAAKMLRQLWGIEADDEALAVLLAPLGADMAACVYARPLWMRGVGDDVTLAEGLPAAYVVLVNPQLPLPTIQVYREVQPEEIGGGLPDASSLGDYLRVARNDLEGAALRCCPDIVAVLAALRQQAGCYVARMSGSGATCFGLFETQEAAMTAASVLMSAYPHWWIQDGALTA